MSDSFDDIDARVKAALDRDLFFVVGAPHSGTTSVQLALDAHPEIRCAGEGHFTDWFGTPLKDLLGAYNAKLTANNVALYGTGGGSHGGFTTGDFRYLLRTAIGLALARLDLAPGTRLVGETTPAYAQRLDVLEALFPAAKVLHVVRDGRTAAAAALAEVPVVRGSESWYGLVETVARQWATDVRKAVVFGASRPDRYHEVRLEDLQADPDTHFAAVLRFLGVDAGVPAAALGAFTAPDVADLDERALEILMRHQGPMLRQYEYV